MAEQVNRATTLSPSAISSTISMWTSGKLARKGAIQRLARSLRHLVDTVTGLADRGIGFRSPQEAIDTTTPGGKLIFHVFAADAR